MSFQQWEWWSGIEDHVKLNKKQLVNGQYIHEPAFIPIEPDADRLPHPLPNFLRKGTNKSNDVVEVIDSCNGLLLCCNYTGKNFKSYFVCNPLTEERVALPCPVSKRSNLVYFGLLADTTSAGYFQYKVVCVFSPKRDDSCSILLVFSSETGKWKEFEERLPALCNESMMGSKVVINSRLFWDCVEGHILVCHLNKNCYELIESPRAPLGRSLWKSKDKLFCYCQGFDDEFPVWSMCVNDDEKEVLEWKLEGCSEEFEMLSEDVSNDFGSWLTTLKGPKPRVGFKIIGVVDVWNLHLQGNDQSLHLHINSCTASQELKLLESHWTAVSRAEEWKTCKRMKADRNWPRLGAGQRGSDAFVSIDSQKNLEREFLYRKSTVHS